MPTTTTSTAIDLPSVGDTDWGTFLNAQTFEDIDALLTSGQTALSVAGGAGTQQLLAAEVLSPMLLFSGVLTGDRVVTLPRKGTWIIRRETSGSFTLTLRNDANGADPGFAMNANAIYIVHNPGGASGLISAREFVNPSGTQTLTNKTLTSPTIAGGALSGTFSGTPTFSGGVIFSGNPDFTGFPVFTSNTPFITYIESDAAADEKRWQQRSVAGVLSMNSLTDAGVFGATAYQIDRTGTTITLFQITATEFDFTGTTLDLNCSGDISGAFTVGGAFTSIGIDDNATAERVEIADTSIAFGASGVDYTLRHTAADRAVTVSGGSSGSNGGNIVLFGGSHASQAGDTVFRQGSTQWAQYDVSATQFELAVANGAKMRPAVSSETGGTLSAVSENTNVNLASDPTLANSVFTAGSWIWLYAGASARTITQGAGTTLRLHGSATTGNRTLAARGGAAIYVVSASEFVAFGDVT